ncbi:hypothetical protein Tco_0620400, partial [Tanacetum coccineum]
PTPRVGLVAVRGSTAAVGGGGVGPGLGDSRDSRGAVGLGLAARGGCLVVGLGRARLGTAGSVCLWGLAANKGSLVRGCWVNSRGSESGMGLVCNNRGVCRGGLLGLAAKAGVRAFECVDTEIK